MHLICHCDANNFFATAATSHDPSLKGKAVVVLGSRQKIVISRSPEAKKMGIAMGAPWFQIKDEFLKKGGIAFAANFGLFAELSSRVFSIIESYFQGTELEIYSIDEVFFSIVGIAREKIVKLCSIIRNHVLQATGITLSFGIDTNKTRAKIATDLAKKDPSGICFIDSDEKRDEIYKNYPCGDVWGIGSSSALKLRLLNIKTAYDLSRAEDKLIRKTLNILRLQTKHELQGISCINLEDMRPDRKQILVSRSFDKKVYERREVTEAISDHAFRATEKLRDEKLVCYTLSIFLKDEFNTYSFRQASLSQGANSHNVLVEQSLKLLKQIYRFGFAYKKCGVMLDDLRPNNERQLSLLESDYAENEQLASLIDKVNGRFQGKLKLMCCSPPEIRNLLVRTTPNYTSSFSELLSATL